MFFFNVQSNQKNPNTSSIILTRHLATKQKRETSLDINTLQNMRKFKVNCRVIQSIIQMPRCTWIYWFQGEKLIFISVKEFYCILLFIFTP